MSIEEMAMFDAYPYRGYENSDELANELRANQRKRSDPTEHFSRSK